MKFLPFCQWQYVLSFSRAAMICGFRRRGECTCSEHTASSSVMSSRPVHDVAKTGFGMGTNELYDKCNISPVPPVMLHLTGSALAGLVLLIRQKPLPLCTITSRNLQKLSLTFSSEPFAYMLLRIAVIDVIGNLLKTGKRNWYFHASAPGEFTFRACHSGAESCGT